MPATFPANWPPPSFPSCTGHHGCVELRDVYIMSTLCYVRRMVRRNEVFGRVERGRFYSARWSYVLRGGVRVNCSRRSWVWCYGGVVVRFNCVRRCDVRGMIVCSPPLPVYPHHVTSHPSSNYRIELKTELKKVRIRSYYHRSCRLLSVSRSVYRYIRHLSICHMYNRYSLCQGTTWDHLWVSLVS